MIFWNLIIKFLSSQLFANLLLLMTVITAFALGYRQIFLNDVVEIYASPSSKEVLIENDKKIVTPIIQLQNTGTRIVYLDKYVFNGVTYLTQGQILPPTNLQSGALYWVDLPRNGISHVSLDVYYHDIDLRHWKTEITADLVDGTWKVSSFPRKEQSY